MLWNSKRRTPDVRERIGVLLGQNPVSDSWRRDAAALAERTTRGMLAREHPVIARLYRFAAGTLPDGTPVADAHPSLAHADIPERIGLELNTPDIFDQPGYESDFDPLNSIPFAFEDSAGIWFSVLALPGTPMANWPIVECMPMGKHNVEVVALDAEGWLHQWICPGRPDGGSPLDHVEEDQARALIRILSEHFGVNAKHAAAAWRAARTNDRAACGFDAYVDRRALLGLTPLIVPQDA